MTRSTDPAGSSGVPAACRRAVERAPFAISRGQSFHCGEQRSSGCDNSNPVEKQDPSESPFGYAVSGLQAART